MNASHTLSANPELDAFVGVAKRNAVPDDALVPLLRQNGWSERRIYRSLSSYYASALGTETPSRSGPAENARDGFSYLVAFITLGTWATALGQIFYNLIDRTFPDHAYENLYGTFSHQMAWQLAALLVAFPIFFFVQRSIEMQLKQKPDAAESGVRKWLTYIALVITAIICMGDAIWFLQALFLGEITTRFLLRTLTLATIGGGIFGYYILGLQRTRAEGT